MPEDGRDGCVSELVRQVGELGDPLGGDERAVGDLLREERRCRERLPVGKATLRERAQDVSACVEDVAVRVAKGAALDPGPRVRYESSFLRMPMNPRNRRQ